MKGIKGECRPLDPLQAIRLSIVAIEAMAEIQGEANENEVLSAGFLICYQMIEAALRMGGDPEAIRGAISAMYRLLPPAPTSARSTSIN